MFIPDLGEMAGNSSSLGGIPLCQSFSTHSRLHDFCQPPVPVSQTLQLEDKYSVNFRQAVESDAMHMSLVMNRPIFRQFGPEKEVRFYVEGDYQKDVSSTKPVQNVNLYHQNLMTRSDSNGYPYAGQQHGVIVHNQDILHASDSSLNDNIYQRRTNSYIEQPSEMFGCHRITDRQSLKKQRVSSFGEAKFTSIAEDNLTMNFQERSGIIFKSNGGQDRNLTSHTEPLSFYPHVSVCSTPAQNGGIREANPVLPTLSYATASSNIKNNEISRRIPRRQTKCRDKKCLSLNATVLEQGNDGTISKVQAHIVRNIDKRAYSNSQKRTIDNVIL